MVQADGRPILPLRPDPRVLEAARALGTLADVLVVTSNAPHLLRAELEAASGLPMLSMIEAVVGAVEAQGWKRVGVLGLGEPRVYIEPLEARGVATAIAPAPARDRLDGAIFGLMEGRRGAEEVAAAREALAAVRAQEVEGVVLGCTEIPLLLGDEASGPGLVNPLQLLAEAVVEYARA
jgi:aspartate racemase